MDVTASNLRAHLSEWPIAPTPARKFSSPIAVFALPDFFVWTPLSLERLVDEGVIGRTERTSRPRATTQRRVRSTASVADLVTEQRR
ncbi:MAG: hypothetical protein ACYCPT_05650 [Acidimicrobiales bacterium]